MASMLANQFLSSLKTNEIDDRYIKPGVSSLITPLNALILVLAGVSALTQQLRGTTEFTCMPVMMCERPTNLTQPKECDYLDRQHPESQYLTQEISFPSKAFVDNACRRIYIHWIRTQLSYVLVIIGAFMTFLEMIPRSVAIPGHKKLMDTFLRLVHDCKDSTGMSLLFTKITASQLAYSEETKLNFPGMRNMTLLKLTAKPSETSEMSFSNKSMPIDSEELEIFTKEANRNVETIQYILMDKATDIEQAEKFKLISFVNRTNQFMQSEDSNTLYRTSLVFSIIHFFLALLILIGSCYMVKFYFVEEFFCTLSGRFQYQNFNYEVNEVTAIFCLDLYGDYYAAILVLFGIVLFLKAICYMYMELVLFHQIHVTYGGKISKILGFKMPPTLTESDFQNSPSGTPQRLDLLYLLIRLKMYDDKIFNGLSLVMSEQMNKVRELQQEQMFITRFVDAAASNDISYLRAKSGHDLMKVINRKATDGKNTGFTALHAAILCLAETIDKEKTHSRMDAVVYLLSNSADGDILIETGEYRGWSALHLAAFWGEADVMACLVASGASMELEVSAGTYKGYTPLQLATHKHHPESTLSFLNGKAVTFTRLSVVSGKLKSESLVKIHEQSKELNEKLIDKAILEGKTKKILRLVNAGDRVGVVTSKKGDVFHAALCHDDHKRIEKLLGPQTDLSDLDQWVINSITPPNTRLVDWVRHVRIGKKTSKDIKAETLEVLMKALSNRLLDAAATGNERLIKALIATDAGASLNVKDKSGRTPCHHAALKNIPAVVDVIVSLGGDVNAVENNGQTPLHCAAAKNTCDMVTCLIKWKSGVNVKDNEGQTPLFLAAANNSLEVVNKLIKAGADVTVKDANGAMALHHVIANRTSNKALCVNIVEALIKAGTPVNSLDDDGWSPLHLAAWKNCAEVVSVLLNAGADVGARGKNDKTPIYLAAKFNSMTVVNVLANGGADMKEFNVIELAREYNTKNPDVWRLLEARLHVPAEGRRIFLQKKPSVMRQNLSPQVVSKSSNSTISPDIKIMRLCNAAGWGEESQVKALIEVGTDINARCNGGWIPGWTPLHRAAARNTVDVVELLLRKGADISLSCPYVGKVYSVMDLARKYNNADVVVFLEGKMRDRFLEAAQNGTVKMLQSLLEAGASLTSVDREGSLTALHHAAWKNTTDVVGLLKELGADVTARTDGGQTPLHFAARYNTPEVVKVLLDDVTMSEKDYFDERPLHHAARWNTTQVVQTFLSAGAEVNITNEVGQTPLHLAALENKSDVVNLLIDNGAEVDAKDNDRHTPLHIAAGWNTVAVVKTLLKRNADIFVMTSTGKKNVCNISEWAAKLNKNHPEVAIYLEERLRIKKCAISDATTKQLQQLTILDEPSTSDQDEVVKVTASMPSVFAQPAQPGVSPPASPTTGANTGNLGKQTSIKGTRDTQSSVDVKQCDVAKLPNIQTLRAGAPILDLPKQPSLVGQTASMASIAEETSDAARRADLAEVKLTIPSDNENDMTDTSPLLLERSASQPTHSTVNMGSDEDDAADDTTPILPSASWSQQTSVTMPPAHHDKKDKKGK